MKRLLIVSETWYPDSRATISIMARIAEGIAQKGVEVYAAPLKFLADGSDYPNEANGIKILSVNNQHNNLKANLRLEFLKLRQRVIHRMLHAEKRLLFRNTEGKWNGCVKHIRDFQRNYWYNPVSDGVRDIIMGQQIAAIIDEYQIDSVISVSLPFGLHNVTAEALKASMNKNVTWVPICFDPYAYDQSIEKKERDRRIRCEHNTYRCAEKVLMLSQSAADYQTDSLLPKLGFFEIPNIRELQVNQNVRSLQLDSSCINCVFIGNLYWSVRNPECMFKLFEQFSDERIRLYVIGSLSYDFPEDYIERWQEKMGTRFVRCGRIGSDEAAVVMSAADVLINIGNTTSNQCPSKVLEYISTGKPILSFSKIPKCTSEAYLKRYPLSCLIHEADVSKHDTVRRVESFILESKNKKVSFHGVKEMFGDCTNEKAVEIVVNAFQ